MNAFPLSIRDLSKELDRNKVLEQIDLTLTPGEFVVIIGASGSGKTTLLRLVGGLERASGGRIEIGGQIVDEPLSRSWVPPERRGLSMVFQEHALWPHLTCLDNILMVLPKQQPDRRQQALFWLERVGVAHIANKRPHQISGGQQQRVGLARALAVQPRLLLLDEPLSSLDVDTRVQLRLTLREVIKETGVSALLVSHDPDDAWHLADRVAVLESGRLTQFASPHEIYHQPATPAIARFSGAQGGYDYEWLGQGRWRLGTHDLFWPEHIEEPPRQGELYIRPLGVAVKTEGEGIPATCIRSIFDAGQYRSYWSINGLSKPLVSLGSDIPPATALLSLDPQHFHAFSH